MLYAWHIAVLCIVKNMEQVVEKTALSDIEKVRAFVEFSRKNPYYNNALEKLNMGENSISQLLAWLLDTNWVRVKKA